MTSSPGQVTQVLDLQQLIDRVVAAGAPGIIAQIETPTQSWPLTSGVADRNTNAPMTSNLRFRIASSTKTFVATVVLQLVDQGLLNLDDRVSRWVPWPPDAPPKCEDITVHHLLGHTSGLFNFTEDLAWLDKAWDGATFQPAELVKIATRRRFTSRPAPAADTPTPTIPWPA